MGEVDKVPGNAKKKRGPGGSRKGIPNKNTAQLKEMILQALDDAGGVAYLAQQAEEKPAAFLALIGKVLPMQITGPGDGPLNAKITVEYVRPKHSAS